MTADLALTKPDPSLDMGSLRVMMEAAQRYVASGLLPSEIKTPQQALLVMQAGKEIGVPATYALRNIYVVKGKVTCSAELLLALVKRAYGPGAIRVGKTSNDACTVQYREQGWDGISEYTFTMDDAKQAGVTGNPTWRSYPAAMLRARCISAVVRFAFPECIAGLYTPEELGAEVEVNEQGEVIAVTEPVRPTLSVVDNTPTEEEKERARAMVEGDGPKSPERQRLETEYARLSTLAGERGHKDADKIKAKTAGELADDVLAASVKSLRAWEQKLDMPF